MIITRHGGGSHYVRPDFTYRTSVLQPMGGYVPQQDVMDVANAFTLGPYAFMQGGQTAPGQGVAGPSVRLLGGPVQFLGWWPPATWGWWATLKAKFAAWKAQRQAASAITAAGTAGVRGLFGFTPMGPGAWAGAQAVPGPSQRVGMLIAMQNKGQPAQIALHNDNALMQRWNYRVAPVR